jgi:hypothetical protein
VEGPKFKPSYSWKKKNKEKIKINTQRCNEKSGISPRWGLDLPSFIYTLLPTTAIR